MNATILRFAGLPMMRGAQVFALQSRLVDLAMLPVEDWDGLFGPRTDAAVRALQARLGLAQTGLADPQTLARLSELERGANGPAPQEPAKEPAPMPAQTAQRPPHRPLTGLDALDLPPARATRIILHWTGGSARASELDRQHYHFCIEQSGDIVAGNRSIADNDSTQDGRYAAHTLNCNTRAIGVALCGMAGAVEKPFHPGRAPIVERQITVLAALVARLCQHYDIPVTPETVLGHGEVYTNLNIKQKGKWDPLVLPWRPDLSKRDTGAFLRAEISRALTAAQPDDAVTEPEGSYDLVIGNRRLENAGIPDDGEDWIRLDQLLRATGWQRDKNDDDPGDTDRSGSALIRADGAQAHVDLRRVGAEDQIDLQDLVEGFNLKLRVQPDGTRWLDGTPNSAGKTHAGAAMNIVTVARGQTLRDIARRHLGSADRWGDIRTIEGNEFSENSARNLAAGAQVLVPAGVAKASAKVNGAAPALTAVQPPSQQLIAGLSQAVSSSHRDAANTAIPLILKACAAHGISDPSHLGYVLATAEHESGFGKWLEEKWEPTADQRKYQGRFGNIDDGDGERFRGRGYAQITFRDNYIRYGKALGLPLETQPGLAAQPQHAANLIALGMGRLGYTKGYPVLEDFGLGREFDFVNARRIINGDSKRPHKKSGQTIGDYLARRGRGFADIIREARP
ncbi:N-acetylmuramoyl-L-alanine amidase [Paracoccus laeviglucosivorans]|uniref:Predicted chitinase n=1 Tax=Paracoccus laeviglucosivorans TaxID=1197861 RepID=A0A521FD70_9RHOB|nr:N-acetylmuramoyl-L-alanine amidase [Paracoccus laeviglucosivorans]SMO93974.1 Predicted chitinase [Paracoccus laeviglucosivorans]